MEPRARAQSFTASNTFQVDYNKCFNVDEKGERIGIERKISKRFLFISYFFSLKFVFDFLVLSNFPKLAVGFF